MIFIINFIIFELSGLLNVWMFYMFLTPKKSILRASLISYLIMLPFATIKFFVKSSSAEDLILQVINNVLFVGIAVIQTKESFLQCILVWIRVMFIFICSGMIVSVTIGDTYDAMDERYTRSYLMSLLYICITFFIVYKLFKRTNTIITGRQSVLLLVSFGAFVQFADFILDRARNLHGYHVNGYHYTVNIIISLFPFVVMLINESIVKELAYKQKRRMIEIDLKNERKLYNEIYEQNQKLAKIRHDIADQIFIARSVANNEPERAYGIMKDLETKIEGEIEGK